MEVNGGMGLVSKVANNVEEGVHMHMVVVANNHKGSTTSIALEVKCTHKKPKEVVAKKVVYMIEAPPTFDYQILDVNLH
ncbi:hypothetical protein AHAS_Ahas07G0118600 [Arachis hypogaea]